MDTLTGYAFFNQFLHERGLWIAFKFLLIINYFKFSFRRYVKKHNTDPLAFIITFPVIFLYKNDELEIDFMKVNLDWQTYYYKLTEQP